MFFILRDATKGDTHRSNIVIGFRHIFLSFTFQGINRDYINMASRSSDSFRLKNVTINGYVTWKPTVPNKLHQQAMGTGRLVGTQAMGSVGLVDNYHVCLQFSLHFLLVGVCIPMIVYTRIMVIIWRYLELRNILLVQSSSWHPKYLPSAPTQDFRTKVPH